jgi:hypothetical protein
LPSTGNADFSAEMGSGSTPRKGAGSTATDTAERPRPAMICVSSPPKEWPTRTLGGYVPGIQDVPASGTRAIADASIVSATRSSGSRLWTCDLPHARASVCASSVMVRR